MWQRKLSFVILNLFIVSFVQGQSLVAVEEYLKNNELKKAKSELQNHPGNPEAIEYLGDIAVFEKKWDKAIKHYRKLLKTRPISANYNFKLGGAMGMKAMEVSKFSAALMIGDIKKYLNRAASLDANHAEVRRALVELYMELPAIVGGSKEVAQQHALELHNLNAVDAHLAEAYIHNYEENEELKRKAVEKALNAAAQNRELLVRNYLFYELGEQAANLNLRPKLAVDFLKSYIENYSYKDLKSPAWAYFHIAKIEAKRNDKKEALYNINKALSVKFGFPEAEKLKLKILEM